MIAPTALLTSTVTSPRQESFIGWRGHLDREQVPPVVAIAGSRGKTSVLRAAEALFANANLRTASRSSGGVEIEGESQRGEIAPWIRTLTRLRSGGLDVAFQEIDWVTVQATAPADLTYPVLAVTNLCANNDACLATPDTILARKSLARIRASLPETAQLVLNAHDFALADDDGEVAPQHYLVGMTPDAPMLRRHLAKGGNACYIQNHSVILAENGEPIAVMRTSEIPWFRNESIPFSVQNGLMATAIAHACGISIPDIRSGLAGYAPRAAVMPGSFNVFDAGPATVVVDRPTHPWFLRTSIRGAAGLGDRRQVRVVGPMLSVPASDMNEVGRLLGRQSGAIIMHGNWPYDRLGLFKLGVAMNDVPPVLLQASDERRAIIQGLEMLRPDDVLLVLAENPAAAVRLVASQVRRIEEALLQSAGAA
jgi:cyanophycin synthetase